MRQLVLFVSVVLLAPVAALAQPASPLPPTPPPVTSWDFQGVYMQANMGGYFALGGDAVTGGTRVSNLEPVAGLELGYDLSKSIGLQFVANMGNVYRAPVDLSLGTTESFSVLLLNLALMYRMRIVDRLAWFVRVGGGAALNTPAVATFNAMSVVPNGLVGVGVQLFTYLEAITVSFEANYVPLIVPLESGGMVLSNQFAVYPSVRYTF